MYCSLMGKTIKRFANKSTLDVHRRTCMYGFSTATGVTGSAPFTLDFLRPRISAAMNENGSTDLAGLAGLVVSRL